MRNMIGLPDGIAACLFDLDGVLTGTAAQHREAWKTTFDEFLRQRDGEHFRPFTSEDYATYVDGLPRADGVRQFLSARGITLPEGEQDDPVDAQTVCGVGNRKNELVLSIIDEQGVHPFPGSVSYLHAVRQARLAIGVVTSSANGATVLEAANLTHFVDARIDGVVIARDKLRGKPAPDSFLAGANALHEAPQHCAIFEDAQSGVQAGKDGRFGYVVGVDRVGQAEQLRAHGADVVVTDLAQLMEGTK